MKRVRSTEPQFGSDSFLDVVANIVGILVILIVVVGMRVANAPSTLGSAELARAESEQERERIERENERCRADQETRLAARAAQLETRAAERRQIEEEQQRIDQERSKRLDAIAERERLLAEYEEEALQLRRQIDDLERAVAAQRTAAAKVHEEQRRIRGDLLARQNQAESLRRRIDEARGHEMEVTKLRRQVEDQLADLRKRLAQLGELPPAKEWIHYALPIAQSVDRAELHYRCAGGRIADTHLEELLQRVRTSAATHDFQRAPVAQGTVGPAGGFRLRYVMGRVARPLSDRTRDPFSYRVELSHWQLLTDDPELGETKDAVSKQSSAFRRSLESRPPHRYAVTLWVYPDSFEIAKAVEGFLHEQGYTVALRPLPTGIPIAASPHGTRSHVQ